VAGATRSADVVSSRPGDGVAACSGVDGGGSLRMGKGGELVAAVAEVATAAPTVADWRCASQCLRALPTMRWRPPPSTCRSICCAKPVPVTSRTWPKPRAHSVQASFRRSAPPPPHAVPPVPRGSGRDPKIAAIATSAAAAAAAAARTAAAIRRAVRGRDVDGNGGVHFSPPPATTSASAL